VAPKNVGNPRTKATIKRYISLVMLGRS
jgi:hypothetical protein